MDSSEYIKNRIQTLTQDSEDIRRQADTTNDFDTWSGLKLILHSAAVNMYTTVLENQEFFEDLYYIDALAGSGVSTHDQSGSCFLGSPVIAAKVAEEPFRKMFLIEKNKNKADALRQRLRYVFENHSDTKEPHEWEVIAGDANKEICNVKKEINRISRPKNRGYNYYCFIDNQELNVKWSTIRELAPRPYGDLLVNLPTASGIGRNATQDPVPGKLNDFYCQDLNNTNVPENNIRPRMKQLYRECLAELDRPVQKVTNVDANVGSYEYDLVYATRETDGGSSYIEVIDYVKELIENVHAGDVNNILEVLENNQSQINQYIPERDIDDKLPESSDKDDSQSSLTDFGS